MRFGIEFVGQIEKAQWTDRHDGRRAEIVIHRGREGERVKLPKQDFRTLFMIAFCAKMPTPRGGVPSEKPRAIYHLSGFCNWREIGPDQGFAYKIVYKLKQDLKALGVTDKLLRIKNDKCGNYVISLSADQIKFNIDNLLKIDDAEIVKCVRLLQTLTLNPSPAGEGNKTKPTLNGGAAMLAKGFGEL